MSRANENILKFSFCALQFLSKTCHCEKSKWSMLQRSPSLALYSSHNSSLILTWAWEWLFPQTPFRSELTFYLPNSNCSNCTSLRSDNGEVVCPTIPDGYTTQQTLLSPALSLATYWKSLQGICSSEKLHKFPSAIGRGSSIAFPISHCFCGQTVQWKDR